MSSGSVAGTPTSGFKDFMSTRSHLDNEYLKAYLDYSIEYDGKTTSTTRNTFYINYDSKCGGDYVDTDKTEVEDGTKEM